MAKKQQPQYVGRTIPKTITTDELIRANPSKNSRRQPVRQPHREAGPPHGRAELKGNRGARAWLHRNGWLLAVAIGWVLAFAAIGCLAVKLPVVTGFELATFASLSFGFGIGWKFGDERRRE